MTLLILIGAITFLAVLAYNLFTDYQKWKEGVSVNHGSSLKKRILLLTVPVLLFAIPVPGSFVWGIFLSAAMLGFTYWTLFDGLYNVMRGFPWGFTGSVEPDDAGTDKLQRRYPWLLWAKPAISLALEITYVILVL